MSTFELTESTFVESVKEPGILLIDWWAPWCAPCRMFGPIYEKVSEKHPDVRFAKVDTESQPGLASAFEIRSIPTLMVVRDSIVLFSQAGMMPERALEALIAQAKQLDMDEVRKEVEKTKQPAAPGSSTPS